MCAGACALFLWDGFFKYPNENARKAWDQFPEEVSQEPVYDKDLTEADFHRIQADKMTLADARKILGEPAFNNGAEVFWVGKAGYVQARINFSEMITSVRWNKGRHTVRDLIVQKTLGALCGFVAIPALLLLVRAAGTRVVLDDEGLHYNRGALIGWDDMKALDSANYKRKRWVTLEYEREETRRRQRLDRYHLARFDEIVAEVCRRKGFASPLKSPDASPTSDTESPTA